MAGDVQDEAKVDGRARRRERNVVAVLEAVHSLLVEGHFNPSPEQVASRSGISLRSLYRYFPDREQLVMAALGHQIGAAAVVFHLDRAGRGSRRERIHQFVVHRVAVHDAMAPVARLALVAARDMPTLARSVHERRAQMRGLVEEQFAPELDPLDPQHRQDCTEAIDLLCQFESIETLRVARGLDDARVHAILTSGVTSLLTATT